MTIDVLGAGQPDQAIGPVLVGERRLKFVKARRQRVADDGFHLALAPGAARLLVGEDLLQAHHLAGKIGEILLGVVDRDQPRLQPAQGFRGLGRGLLEVLPQALVERLQPLGDGALQIVLALGLGLDGLGKAPGDFVLCGGEIAQFAFQQKLFRAALDLPLAQHAAQPHERVNRQRKTRQHRSGRHDRNPNLHRIYPRLAAHPSRFGPRA